MTSNKHRLTDLPTGYDADDSGLLAPDAGVNAPDAGVDNTPGTEPNLNDNTHDFENVDVPIPQESRKDTEETVVDRQMDIIARTAR